MAITRGLRKMLVAWWYKKPVTSQTYGRCLTAVFGMPRSL